MPLVPTEEVYDACLSWTSTGTVGLGTRCQGESLERTCKLDCGEVSKTDKEALGKTLKVSFERNFMSVPIGLEKLQKTYNGILR